MNQLMSTKTIVSQSSSFSSERVVVTSQPSPSRFEPELTVFGWEGGAGEDILTGSDGEPKEKPW